MKKAATCISAFIVLVLLFYGYWPHYSDDVRPHVLTRHEAGDIRTWSVLMGRPLAERIGITADFAVDYVRQDTSITRIGGGYTISDSGVCYSDYSEELAADSLIALNSLPDAIKKVFDDHLLGVLFVENLGSTGIAYVVPGHWGRTYGFIAIDASKVNMPINEWYASKEISAFSGDSEFRLESILDDDDNSRVSTLRHLLLHEMGHIFAAARGLEPPHYSGKDRMKYPFIKLSWKYDGRSIYDENFPNRMYLKFYSEDTSLVPENELLQTYEDLRGTNFISLYASTSNTEDIAEVFAFYVHCMILGEPHIIRLYRGDSLVFEMKNVIYERRFRNKVELIRKHI